MEQEIQITNLQFDAVKRDILRFLQDAKKKYSDSFTEIDHIFYDELVKSVKQAKDPADLVDKVKELQIKLSTYINQNSENENSIIAKKTAAYHLAIGNIIKNLLYLAIFAGLGLSTGLSETYSSAPQPIKQDLSFNLLGKKIDVRDIERSSLEKAMKNVWFKTLDIGPYFLSGSPYYRMAQNTLEEFISSAKSAVKDYFVKKLINLYDSAGKPYNLKVVNEIADDMTKNVLNISVVSEPKLIEMYGSTGLEEKRRAFFVALKNAIEHNTELLGYKLDFMSTWAKRMPVYKTGLQTFLENISDEKSKDYRNYKNMFINVLASSNKDVSSFLMSFVPENVRKEHGVKDKDIVLSNLQEPSAPESSSVSYGGTFYSLLESVLGDPFAGSKASESQTNKGDLKETT